MVDAAAIALMQTTMQQFHLSARAFHRILADLVGSDSVLSAHVAEALQ